MRDLRDGLRVAGCPVMSDDFKPNLDAYFARIGYTGARTPTYATLQGILFAHATSIPFENIDVLLGRGISLDPVKVEQKLVHDRRGGYCFEQNSTLLRGLLALGFDAKPLSARVRWMRPRDFTPPRTHLFVRVDLDGETWLVDAGVGSASLTTPIRFIENIEQQTSHDQRRIVRADGKYFHQMLFNGEWNDVCEFTGEEMPPIDRELANWYTSAHPQSHFKANLLAGRATQDGRVSLLNRELTFRSKDGSATKHEIATHAELLDVLAKHFGLNLPADTQFTNPGLIWPA